MLFPDDASVIGGIFEVVHIVDRPRHSLDEHARVVSEKLVERGIASTVYSCVSDADPSTLSKRVWKVLRDPSACVVVWSVGRAAALLGAGLVRARAVLVLHEPGSFVSRLRKNRDVVRSLAAHVLLAAARRCARVIAVPNASVAAGLGAAYLPLFFDLPPDASHRDGPLFVVHLGARLSARATDVFEELASRRDHGWECVFFPGGSDSSESAKARLLSRRAIVVNPFRVRHNQSAVTVDALRYGVPVVVSEHDVWADCISRVGAGVVLPAGQIDVASLVRAVQRIDGGYSQCSYAARKLAEELFSDEVFDRTWASTIRRLLDGAKLSS